LNETDPLTGNAVNYPPQMDAPPVTLVMKAYQYDQYGRVSGLTMPEGYKQSVLVYDFDDELAGYTADSTLVRTFTLNARGEMLEDNSSSPAIGYAQGPTFSANGAQVGDGDTAGSGPVTAPPTTLQYDVRTNMATCIPNPQWALGTFDVLTYNYDGAGREVGISADTSKECVGGSATTNNYDAENHLESSTNPNLPGMGNNASATVQWGPDGRQRIDQRTSQNNGTSTETAHWDGDAMLFSTSADSTGAYLYIGKLGMMDASGNILVSDRDQTGTQQTFHTYTPTSPPGWDSASTAYWFGGWSFGSVRNLYAGRGGQMLPPIQLFPGSCGLTYQGTTYPCPPGIVPPFQMTRSDGYAMIGGLVQGARTYDSTSGQWLTPDPYGGNVHDPMSQKPFMWNNNNPVAWSDPSGYCSDPGVGQKPNGCLGGVDWNLNMNFANALQAVLSWVAIPAGGEAGGAAKAAVLANKIADEQLAKAIMGITDRN
jgi:RHS repeat-associated protein